MDLLALFVGICMVFVVYIEVDVEGAIYDEACTADTDCTEMNAEKCDIGTTDKCICIAGHFRKTTTAECIAQIALNANCDTAQTSPDQCSIANSECRDDGTGTSTDKCLCESTHYETGGACVLRIAYGDPCTGDGTDSGDCTETTNIVCDTTCKCTPGSFRKTNAEQCDAQVALNANCDVADTATDQCSIANSECTDDGTGTSTDKCLCESTHYETGGACVLRNYPDANCGGDECVINASCVETKCACDAGYIPSPTVSPTMCNGVVKTSTLTHMYVVPVILSLMFLLR